MTSHYYEIQLPDSDGNVKTMTVTNKLIADYYRNVGKVVITH